MALVGLAVAELSKANSRGLDRFCQGSGRYWHASPPPFGVIYFFLLAPGEGPIIVATYGLAALLEKRKEN